MGVKRLSILHASKVHPVNTQQAIVVVDAFVPVVKKDLKKGERTDEIEIELPAHFAIEFLPTNFELNTKFGEYKTEIIKTDNNKLIYKRKMLLNNGKYSNKEYDEYRLFIEQINKNDNAKIILTKN